MSLSTALSLTENKPAVNLINQLQEHGFVKIPQALTTESAGLIAKHINEQQEWNLVFNHQGKHQDLNAQAVDTWTESQQSDLFALVHQQAASGFQYLYENIPLYDIYFDNLLPGHFFNQIIEFLNTETTLNYFRELLGVPEISFADGQITRYGPGHFLNVHDDNVEDKNRVAAFVINLTNNWRADWGGALHLLDKEHKITQSFLPSYNEINIFKIPVDHYVGYVSPFAQAKRISITGWLRTGINPKTKEKN
ncbi:2OG-Fe(II) oxygenase [Colwellia sp. MEBiC06753]